MQLPNNLSEVLIRLGKLVWADGFRGELPS